MKTNLFKKLRSVHYFTSTIQQLFGTGMPLKCKKSAFSEVFTVSGLTYPPNGRRGQRRLIDLPTFFKGRAYGRGGEGENLLKIHLELTYEVIVSAVIISKGNQNSISNKHKCQLSCKNKPFVWNYARISGHSLYCNPPGSDIRCNFHLLRWTRSPVEHVQKLKRGPTGWLILENNVRPTT